MRDVLQPDLASGGPAMNGTLRPIGEARPQTRVIVTGTIRATATATVGGTLAYRCLLADGSGEIEMLFLGRAAIRGLEPGRRCTAEGTACARGGHLVIWNPRYQLEPDAEESICDRSAA